MTTAPYFDSKKNSLTKRSKALQYVVKRCIIESVGVRLTKGGCCDYNGGIYHSQGGVNRTGTLRLPGERNAPTRPYAGFPRRQRMAHSSIRVRGMEEIEAKAEPIPAASVKLNSSSVATTCGLLSFSGSQATSGCVRYLIVHYKRESCHMATRTDGLWVAWKGIRHIMTTTSRIPLFDANGGKIGRISPLALAALIDSGLLDDERPTVETSAPTNGPCIEPQCDNRREIGIFCSPCFHRLRIEMPGFAAEWHTSDWTQACEQARSEVPNG